MKEVYTLDDLRQWKTATADEDQPIQLAVFGDPINHSLSPQMHNAALEHLDLGCRYGRLHIPVKDLKEALHLLRDHGFIGANLTIPHKVEVLPFLDDIDSQARKLGAVNTVVIEDGEFIGFNTDGPGIARTIRAEFDLDLSDLRVMIIGAAGGAGRAAAVQCALEGSSRLVLVNRTVEKLEPLYQELKGYFPPERVSAPIQWFETCPLEEKDLRRQMDHVDLIINATSLGMKRMDPSPLPANLLQAHHLVYDMVYGKGKTKLLSAAADAGARGAGGLSMLLYQGALSFEIWFQRDAPVQIMKEGLWRAAGYRMIGDPD
jgi:shikimate dehydrogenase